MMSPIFKLSLLGLFLFTFACSEQQAENEPNITNRISQINDLFYSRNTAKTFDDALLDLEFAIAEENFRIIENLKIGKAIQERGNEAFPRNEVVVFCNLRHAEKLLVIYPEFITYCPFKATVREHDGEVIVATMLLPEQDNNKAYQLLAENINDILRDIVNYAAEDDPFVLEGDYEDET